MPKFRGNSEDWLDDERSGGGNRTIRSRKGAGKTARSIALPWDQANALVVEVFPNQCRIRMNGKAIDVEGVEGESEKKLELLCAYRRAEVVGKSPTEVRERTPVTVGDRVLVKQTGPTHGIIEGICARKNCLIRPAPGREVGKHQHVLAANLDALVMVASTHEPEFSGGLVDRVLIGAQIAKIPVALCITKVDLQRGRSSDWAIYEEIGYPVFELSARTGLGLDDFFHWIEGKTIAFCGQSGVGKTSLLRSFLGRQVGRVNEVNPATGKGRHTTTGSVLFEGRNKTLWIDTPGVKEFGLFNVAPDSLALYFPEFSQLPCMKKGCLHREELSCDARELKRYASYRRILESLLSGES